MRSPMQDNASISSFSEDSGSECESLVKPEIEYCTLENSIIKNLPTSCQEWVYKVQNCRHLDYSQYVDAVDHIRTQKAAELTELERIDAYNSAICYIYTHFSREYPLTEEMYREWIEILQKTGMNQAQIDAMYSQATKDYWSVDMSIYYLERILQEQQLSWEEKSKRMDQILATIGFHYARGHEIWKLCRDAVREEIGLTAAMDALYQRQLLIPLEYNDLTMSEYRAWRSYQSDDISSEKTFDSIVKRHGKYDRILGKRMKEFEQSLSTVSADLEDVWIKYLDYLETCVKSAMDKGLDSCDVYVRVMRCFYERAVKDVCMSSRLWSRYIAHVKNHENSEMDRLVSVAKRAVRNVNMDSSIWTEYLIALEQCQDYESIETFLHTHFMDRQEKGLTVMDAQHALLVLLIYCDIHRRKFMKSSACDREKAQEQVRSVFKACIAFYHTHFPKRPEFLSQLKSYHAHCELLASQSEMVWCGTEITDCDRLWEENWESILSSRSTQAETWLQYLRALLIKRVIYEDRDIKRMICYPSETAIKTIRTLCFERAHKKVLDYPLQILEVWNIFEREHGDLYSFQRVRKLCLNAYSASQMTNPKQTQADVSKKRAHSSSTAAAVPKKLKTTATIVKPKEVAPFKNDDKYTVFIGNIDKRVSKDQLLQFLSEFVVSVDEVRLVCKERAHAAKSRGFAYITLADEDGLQAALRLNGCKLMENVLTVTRANEKTRNSSLPISEPENSAARTLYIGNLKSMIEMNTNKRSAAKLESILLQAVKSVLPDANDAVSSYVQTEQRGNRHPKDYGLVEFASQQALTKLLEDKAMSGSLKTNLYQSFAGAESKNEMSDGIVLKQARNSISELKKMLPKANAKPFQKRQKGFHPQKRIAVESLRPRVLLQKRKEMLKQKETVPSETA